MVERYCTVAALRTFAKSCAVLLLGRARRPRRILRGLAAGCQILVSPAGHLGYLLGTSEPHLQRAIREHVRAGDIVYDVGANMGYVSLSLAKCVGPAGRVIAFEPLPQNLELLRANIRNNGLLNIEVIDVAAADKPGEAVIRVAENLSTASLVWHRDEPSAVQIQIRTVAIDDLVEAGQIGTPTFVKVDVEGGEGEVFWGMQRTIAKAHPVIFVECSDTGRETTWHLLSELGYQCQSAITLKRINALHEYRHSDFLWLPSVSRDQA